MHRILVSLTLIILWKPVSSVAQFETFLPQKPAFADGATLAREYTNPIGGAIRMGDPFILVDSMEFFLYGTTATGTGFKYWRSMNLTDWKEGGFAYRKHEDSWPGKTFWAPEVAKIRGQYYMVFSAQPESTKDFSVRICLAVSDRPEGPFEDLYSPLLDDGESCIDGHLFVDTDGTPYLFFTRVGVVVIGGKRFLSGKNYGAKLKPDLSGIDGEPMLCSEADQPWELPALGRSRCTEGAFVFQENGTYYMTYSANHYAEPFYGIGYSTAPSPLGPWTKSPDNPLVSQVPDKDISGPGHNCMIKLPGSDDWFMVYHTHADPSNPSGERKVNIDRLIIRDDGRLELKGPTRTPQPLPLSPK
ncbi:MAG: glycoside hydrolase family 43 protein [Verrucomicrobiales bacterium]